MHDSSQPSEFAKKRLADACRTKDTSRRLAWAITLGEAILLGVMAVALMDYWFMLPVSVRSAGAGVLVLLVGLGLFRLIRVYRRPTPLKEAALDVEAQRPELGCEVSTAAEYLSGERKITKEYEPELVAALEAKAAEDLRVAQVQYERRLIRPAVLLFGTLLALLIFVVAAPVALTALRRAALPFSSAHYTQVAVSPGTLEIPVGQDVHLTNRFSGRAPQNPQVHFRVGASGAWQAETLSTRSSDGAYLYTWKAVREPVEYRVTGNDAVSPDYQIKTYVPPEVKDLTVRIEYPAYTHLPPTDQKSADITALRASTVQFQVDPSVKLSKARLRLSTAPEAVDLAPTPAGTWAGTLTVSKDADYWIELADEQGHRGLDAKPHHIKAIPDAPPRVEIDAPAQDTHASATNKLPVKISVADDFGVEQVKLSFHKVGGGPEQVVTAQRQTNELGEVSATADLDLSALELKDYELVEYHAEAKDNNTLDGPGVGKSPVYFVEITNLEGGVCKNPKPGQKVNLLVMQKQIIADTAALSPNVSSNQFVELSTRQKDAKDFGQIYLSTLSGLGAPEGALSDMRSAVQDMDKAAAKLTEQVREQALPPEESALAHLYQVLKQLPELEDMPTQPKPTQTLPKTNQLAVVLEAIKEKKKEQPEDDSIQQALQQAQSLAQAQAAINQAMRHPSQGSSKSKAQPQAQGQGQGQGQGKGQGKGQGQSSPQKNESEQPPGAQNSDAPESKEQVNPGSEQLAQSEQPKENGAGKGKGQGKAQAKGRAQGKGKGQSQAAAKAQGQGQGQGQAQGGKGQGQAQGQPQQAEQASDNPNDPGSPENPEELAQQEQQLSKEAQDLAAKLERLAGKDKRVGHNAGQNAKLGGQKIASASNELKKGNFGSAGVNGFQGELALRQVAAQLDRALKNQPDLTDVSSEDAPKQYEPLISEYFKKLSHAE